MRKLDYLRFKMKKAKSIYNIDIEPFSKPEDDIINIRPFTNENYINIGIVIEHGYFDPDDPEEIIWDSFERYYLTPPDRLKKENAWWGSRRK